MPARGLTSERVLGPRDDDLIRALTTRFRLVTVSLVAALWGSSPAYVGRRLRQLVTADFLVASRVPMHPMLPLSKPLVVWSPGDPEPDANRVSYRLQTRWVDSPVATTVYLASRHAVHPFGGSGGRFEYPLQATHDLHVAALYVRLAADSPGTLTRWRGEETLRFLRKRGKVPDAVLVDEREKPVRAIEFGGGYGPRRVRAFHRVCENRRLAYELW